MSTFHNIGQTNPEYVVVELSDDKTSAIIRKNGDNSDGITLPGSTPGVVHLDGETSVFYDNRATLKTITIEEGIVEIGSGLFNRNTALETITIPQSVIKIHNEVFKGCTKLRTVTAHDGIEYLGDSVFENCSNLTTFTPFFPSGLKTIGNSAFSGCSKLKANGGNLDKIVEICKTLVPYGLFNGCRSLDCEFPLLNEGVEEIGAMSFSSCQQMTGELRLPSTVRKIKYGAFQACTSLTGELILPETLEYIGDFAFNHLPGLTNKTLTIPVNLATIGGDTYSYSSFGNIYTSGLQNGEEPSGIGSHSFYDFATKTFEGFNVASSNQYFQSIGGVLYSKDGTRLVSVPSCVKVENNTLHILEGVTKIDELAFSRIIYGEAVTEEDKMTTVVLPDSYVISSGEKNCPRNFLNRWEGNTLAVAFYNYSNVQEVKVKPTNPNYVTIDGCVYSKDCTTLYYAPSHKVGTMDIYPLTLKIDIGAFFDVGNTARKNLTKIIIPQYVKEIEDSDIEQLNKFNKTSGKTVEISVGNTALIERDGEIVRFKTGLPKALISNVKIITSGTVPTVDKLRKGELAFGIINGNLELYVNADDTVRRLISVPTEETVIPANRRMKVMANSDITNGEDNNIVDWDGISAVKETVEIPPVDSSSEQDSETPSTDNTGDNSSSSSGSGKIEIGTEDDESKDAVIRW